MSKFCNKAVIPLIEFHIPLTNLQTVSTAAQLIPNFFPFTQNFHSSSAYILSTSLCISAQDIKRSSECRDKMDGRYDRWCRSFFSVMTRYNLFINKHSPTGFVSILSWRPSSGKATANSRKMAFVVASR